MKLFNYHHVFTELLKAGLWERDVSLSTYKEIDFEKLFQLSELQSVVGLITSGLEHVVDYKVPKDIVLTFVASSLQLEQRNKAMNVFAAKLIEVMRGVDIYTLIVKGQGIAQCYERPLLRACGDVDLLLSESNYNKAIQFLSPFASSIDKEDIKAKHYSMIIDSWTVELHGKLGTGLWREITTTISEVQNEVFCGGAVRSWMNGNTQIFLPRADEDVVFVFTHILQHFFNGGIGLRQICDWCRLLWVFRDSINRELLESRLKKMKVMTEWKVFASLGVNVLGMPMEAMPLYSQKGQLKQKGHLLYSILLCSGNFGCAKDNGYKNKYPMVVRLLISFNRHLLDGVNKSRLFPLDTFKMWCKDMVNATIALLKGQI